ncbi:MAG: hypothetical protein JRJ38_16960 [Deltaproteobacteria bacterium]|nr:hypothetical protein [Deltaproteobacteria bacterium]
MNLIPDKMKDALSKSTADKRHLLEQSLTALKQVGLNVYSTDSPDIRVRHPKNNIVFCTLWFQSRLGARFEIRIDSCPRGVTEVGDITPTQIRQYDSGSRARWAVYRVNDNADIEVAIEVVRKVLDLDPAWG